MEFIKIDSLCKWKVSISVKQAAHVSVSIVRGEKVIQNKDWI